MGPIRGKSRPTVALCCNFSRSGIPEYLEFHLSLPLSGCSSVPRGSRLAALSSLLPLVGFHGPLQELNVFEPCVERELLEVVPEVSGYLEVEIDQCLRDSLPRWRAPEDSVIGVFSFVARMVLASMADGFLDMGFYSLVVFSEFANIR